MKGNVVWTNGRGKATSDVMKLDKLYVFWDILSKAIFWEIPINLGKGIFHRGFLLLVTVPLQLRKS